MPQEESVLRLGRDEALEAARLWQECGDAREFACRVLGGVMNALMDSEAQQMCGASRNERSDGRENSRNGYRPRSLKTAVGDVELEIPKLRHGTYYPEGMLARWSRVDTSVASIVQEMYVCGVSTRKVERVASKLGISSLSSSEVSSLCSDLDAEVEEFRRRDLSGTPCCYLWLDATYMSCRVGSSVVSQGVVTAIGLGADGRKHFLGCDVVDTESEDSWAAFLGGLRERGLAGVRLVVSDSHAGLVAAVSRLFQGCAWQRCVTHLQRNLQSACSGRPEDSKAAVRDLVHAAVYQDDPDLARCVWAEAWIGYTDVDSSGRGAGDGRAVYEGPQAPEAFHRRVQEADSRPLQRRQAQARDHGRVRPRQEHRGEVDQVDKRDRFAARRGQPHARAEPDPGARAREPQAPDGGRRLKTSGADIRSKVRAIAANEGRYPISAQCRLLGVARSTYYSMRSRADRPAAPDPAAPAVVAAHAASKGRYGSRKIKASLERSGVTVSRRRVCRIMRENGLVSAYGRKRFKVHPGAVNEADVPNVVARGFGGRAPRTHICSDLTYVRVGASWNYVCLLVDLYNREIVGHSAGPRKDARLVKSAFATLSFPISDIEVFHTDRGSEFDNAEIDLMLEAFGIERSLSAKGCPYDNAVDESTNRILKAELVHRETFGTTRELRAKLSDYVHWYNNFRIHSTLGYMSPVEFREAGLCLPESSK